MTGTIGTRETLCTHCEHIQVCKYKDQFLKAQEAVDDLTVSTGERSMIKLRDIPWIQNVGLLCNFFISNKIVREPNNLFSGSTTTNPCESNTRYVVRTINND